MKTILVATDFSSPASNAVDYAAHIAHETGAGLVIFNVFKLSNHASHSLASNTGVEIMMAKSEQQLLELAKEIIDRFEIKVRWELWKDNTIESLKEYTLTHAVDLVVMGIESNLVEYKLFGNTTTAAIRLMQFPLLVVPNDIKFEGINKVMYACEASYLKENCRLDVLKQFVKDFDADLDVFHVNTQDMEKDEELEKVINEKLKDQDHAFKYVHHRNVGEGIKEGLKKYPADLLVMVPHRMGFFESLVKGSNTSHMTLTTRVPLLVIPNDKVC